MRLIAVMFLAALTLVAAPQADAATTRQQQSATRPAASTATTVQARRQAAPRSTARTAAARTPTAANRSTPARNRAASASAPGRNGSGAACERRDSRGRCIGPRTASWQGGLPVAANTQSDCPAGTMATLARGHSSVTRCMPL